MCYNKIMKKFFSYLLSLPILCLLCLSLVGCLREMPTDTNDSTTPPVVDTTINYVSLGDSIAEGYALTEYNQKSVDGFVPESYAQMFKSMLEEHYEEVNAVNYATAGDTSGDLLNLLTPLLSTELADDSQTMKTNIQNADIISVCIGANDILGPAIDNFAGYVMGSVDITQSLDAGLTVLSNNFKYVVTTLQTLNPTCKLVFLNVYNPYKEFMTTTKSVSISTGFFPITLDSAILNEIGSITEVYLDSGSTNVTVGGQQTTKTISAGVNQVIESTIENEENCYLLDVKDCFDTYFQTKVDESAENKYDIVNSYLLSVDSAVNLDELTVAIDPHPNTEGHELIFNLLDDWYGMGGKNV